MWCGFIVETMNSHHWNASSSWLVGAEFVLGRDASIATARELFQSYAQAILDYRLLWQNVSFDHQAFMRWWSCTRKILRLILRLSSITPTDIETTYIASQKPFFYKFLLLLRNIERYAAVGGGCEKIFFQHSFGEMFWHFNLHYRYWHLLMMTPWIQTR